MHPFFHLKANGRERKNFISCMKNEGSAMSGCMKIKVIFSSITSTTF
jgi:hypothetical protein